MKFATLFSVFAATAQAQDYFFRYQGGNDITDGQRLRGNISDSTYMLTPGVTLPPHSPDDHFLRLYPNKTTDETVSLIRVETHPHPPPVPAYFGLYTSRGFPSLWRLIYTYHPKDLGPGFYKDGWLLRDGSEPDTKRLEFPDVDGGNTLAEDDDNDDDDDKEAKWRWIAVKQVINGIEKWVPWYVQPRDSNKAILDSWTYVNVTLELVEAKGPVDSNAPGGVRED